MSVVALALALGAVRPTVARAAQYQVQGTATALFGAFGSVGLISVPRPAEFESEFAVTVVEINSSVAMTNVPVTELVLLDRHGRITVMKRVVEVEVFEPEPYPKLGLATEARLRII
jgi:hypothetical protein